MLSISPLLRNFNIDMDVPDRIIRLANQAIESETVLHLHF